jgi:hypothetical protein
MIKANEVFVFNLSLPVSVFSFPKIIVTYQHNDSKGAPAEAEKPSQ